LKTGDKILCESMMEAHIEETIQKIRKKNRSLTRGMNGTDKAALAADAPVDKMLEQ
jgi:hypothetical protein